MAAPKLEPKAGALLIAPPMMLDPNFHRTVVLLCEHGPEGSFGLILNRPLDVTLSEVVHGVESASETYLSLGGPVQPETLHFLHTHGPLVANTVPVLDGIYWGGDFDALKLLIETGQTSASDLRFFVGYAGWSPGQLDEEIEDGGWIVAVGYQDAIFPTDASLLWRAVLRRMGGEFAILANFPDDPRTN